LSSITVSFRGKIPYIGTEDWLAQYYKYFSHSSITHVFGFTPIPSPLYGGQLYIGGEVSNLDYRYMQEHNIGLKIPLTGAFFSDKDYNSSKKLLNEYHSENNTIVVTKDILARRIREDFPLYKVDASVQKNTHPSEVEELLSLYDSVELPSRYNDDIGAISTLPKKDRVVLFGNVGCEYNCPSKTCHPSISRLNRGQKVEGICSQRFIPREVENIHNFNTEVLRQEGFSNFKYVPVKEW
jgi:hypothetical protein